MLIREVFISIPVFQMLDCLSGTRITLHLPLTEPDVINDNSA